MADEFDHQFTGHQWALPDSLEIPKDKLRARLDFYQDTLLFYLLEDGVIKTKMISAHDLAMVLLRDVPMNTGLLPESTLWWRQKRGGPEVALWRPPRVWKVALQAEAFKPAERFNLPLPGLIFLCEPGHAPRVFAAKKRPKSPREVLYHAPLFNLFHDGRTCAGTHKFPPDVGKIPESFFTSFFTMEANTQGRSRKYPDSLIDLWKELDGQKRYPLKDLVPAGKIEEILQ